MNVRNLMVAAALGASALAFSGPTASAAIVCSGDDCWHSHETYDYPASAHVIVHPDSWSWSSGDHYRWREHEGRGYWHGESWTDF